MTRNPSPRRGLISLATVFVILALALLLALLVNASRVVHRKVEAQTAADASAHAAGVQAARGLNQITAVNHLSGELLALAVLAHAAGGPELESNPTAGGSGAAIGAARRTLLAALAESDRLQAADPNGALQVRAAIAAEWDTLDRLEAVARTDLVPLKRLCVGTLIPDLARHARRVAEGTPARMEATAAEVGQRHGAEAAFLPGGVPALPVVSEAESVAAAGWERSQLVRAATPWVQYWRQPVLAFAARHLPRSRYADHYRDWTNTYTLELARRLGTETGAYLYVPTGAAQGHAWSARRPTASLFAPTVFRQPRPSGVAAVAQVDLYTPVGFDTLNWHGAVPEYAHGLRQETQPIPQPRVRVNWRARLAPVTLPLPAPFDHPVPTH